MMSTLSLSSPLFLAAPPKVQGVISCQAALASPSWNSVRVHGGRQLRRATIVNVLGRKSKTRESIVPDPDYRLPIVILGIAGAFAYADNLLAAAPVGLLGCLLLLQTTRVRFVFDDEALEVKVGDQLEESGENVFVGGKNRWKTADNFMMLWWSVLDLRKLAYGDQTWLSTLAPRLIRLRNPIHPITIQPTPLQPNFQDTNSRNSSDHKLSSAPLLPGEAAAGTAAMETLLSPSTLLTPLRGSTKKPASPAASSSPRSVVSCALRRQQQPPQAVAAWRGDGGVGSWTSFLQHGLAAAALSLAISMAPAPAPAVASEFDVLNGGPPEDTYVVDDAGVLSRVTKSDVKRLIRDLESRKNIRINFITVRKLTSKADAFEYADQLLEKWYPTVEEGNNKGIVVLVTSQKEGAITGGPAFVQAVGDEILDSTVSENLPVLATDEKYNEAIYTTAKRLAAAIDGLPDPGGPSFKDNKRESNFKTKEETEEKRGQFTLVVGGLLVIAFVVPMAQYYAYISKK
uniref:TPM domain-containing protein n=1 Tax=Oryza punctata TaxID=4537 RepID=A0A0E0L2B1_ORYPU